MKVKLSHNLSQFHFPYKNQGLSGVKYVISNPIAETTAVMPIITFMSYEK